MCSVIPKAGNILLQFGMMIDHISMMKVLEIALQVKEIESLTLMVTQVNEPYTLSDTIKLVSLFQ